MGDSTRPVLEYHHPDDPRFSLQHVTDDEARHRSRLEEFRGEERYAYVTAHEEIGGTTACLIYAHDAPEEALPDVTTEGELLGWFEGHFDEDELQIVLAIYRAYRGIMEAKAATDDQLRLYKQMQLEKIPAVVDDVSWGQPVPDVGAELLSRFILAHPMPNTNHRTGISLLDRYLTSVDETFTLPETGEENEWYPWIVAFIHDSKRLLTLRRKLPLFRHAANVGYRSIRRKEGVIIDLEETNLGQTDAFGHYSKRHRARTREFVDDLLEQAGAEGLRDEVDDGKAAFVDRLRTDQ